MTSTQVAAMRTFWATSTAGAVWMTAREMALTSHNLNAAGDKATTSNGQVWYWVNATERWTLA